MATHKGTYWVCFALWIVLAAPVYADLDTAINRAILKATAEDTTRTDRDKLFENRCETIAATVGFENDVTGAARKFSCDELGVGIALYAGADLGKHSPEKVGQYLVDALAKEGLKAKVFIKDDHDYGTGVGFYINGRSWLRESVDPVKGIEMLEGITAEAKLILLTDGRVDRYIMAPSEKN